MHINVPKNFVSMVLLVAELSVPCTDRITRIKSADTTQYINHKCQILNNKSTDI